jgi:hypothetical protein
MRDRAFASSVVPVDGGWAAIAFAALAEAIPGRVALHLQRRRQLRCVPLQPHAHAGINAAEPDASPPDAPADDEEAHLGQDRFHAARTQAGDVARPDRLPDDIGRDAGAGVGHGPGRHPPSLVRPRRSDQGPASGDALLAGGAGTRM